LGKKEKKGFKRFPKGNIKKGVLKDMKPLVLWGNLKGETKDWKCKSKIKNLTDKTEEN